MDAPREPSAPTDEPHAWPVESLRFAPRRDAPGMGRLQRTLVGVGVVALHAWLWWFVDSQSGITQYEWAVGTTPGGTQTQAFTNVGLSTSATNPKS